MERAEQFAYAARIVGVVVFSVGIGGAVLGAYAPLQESLDRCGYQTLQVTPAIGGDDHATGTGPEGFTFEGLSPSERDAFETGLDTRTGEADAGYGLDHETALKRGALVTYHNRTYQFSVVSSNRCVDIDPLILPLGLAGVLLGTAIYGIPSLRRLLE